MLGVAHWSIRTRKGVMATPTIITISGHIFEDDGVPAVGEVVLLKRPLYVSHVDGTVFEPFTERGVTDADGFVSIDVISTNDPAWTPVGWTYSVSIGDRSVPYRFNAAVPYDAPGGALTLGQLLPALAVSAGILYAPFNHTHDVYITQAELDAALEDVVGPDLSTYATDIELADGLALKASKSANLSDLGSISAARTNLGLGGAAVLNVGTTAGTVAAGDAAAAALDRSNHTGSQPTSTITGLDATLSAKADLVGGVVPSSQIPAVALVSYLGQVASQAAMLALIGQPGDWATRSDIGSTWQITGPDPTQLGDWTQLLTPTDAVSSVNGQVGVVTLGKGDVGLGNVDNTSDLNKPISTASQLLFDLKANLASPTFTGTVSGITKGMVGLSNVDNTADTAKPVSTDQQTALDLKAPLTSPTFTGTVAGITKSMVGLGNVDNTSDADKPVSTDQQAALDVIVASLVQPTDHNLIGWTFDSALVQGGTTMPNGGLVNTARIKVLDDLVTNILFHLTGGGTSLTSGQCFAALYDDDDGSLLGITADQATAWASGGMKTMALVVPAAVTPNTWVRVGWWCNGTTGPNMSRGVNSSSAILNAGLTVPRYGSANTGRTTTAPDPLGALTGSATGWWVGLS